jgi:hypothetical protein
MVCNTVTKVCPSGRTHVARINRRCELIGKNLCVELLEFWHMDEQMFKIKRLEGSRLRITVHTDRAASIDEKYLA